MRMTMTLSERFLSGFALAATIAKDPGAEQARAGLSSGVAEAWTASARAVLTLSKLERRSRVGGWMQPLHAPTGAWPSSATEPRRAYGLLAQRSATSTWPSWLQSAPLPRAGFAPEPQLIALLRRIVAQHSAREAAWDE